MAKAIKVANASSGAVYNTIPGSTGDLNKESTPLDDTIFGQGFSSSEIGLINWGVTANGLYKGFPGYRADLRKAENSSAITGEAMSLVGGTVYKTTDAAENCWDRSVEAVVYDGASVLLANEIEWIDYLHGQVKLVAAPGGAVTVDVNSFTLTDFGKAQTFSLTQSADVLDITDLASAQANGGFRIFVPTLKTVALELGGFYDLANDFFNILKDRAEIIIDLNPDGSNLSRCRGFYKLLTDNQTGDVGGDETESATFNLTVPTGLTAPPFSWVHDSATTLDQSIQDILAHWENRDILGDELLSGVPLEELMSIQYLPDGVTGNQGDVLVTEASLAGGVDAMNEFSFSFQGSGVLTAI